MWSQPQRRTAPDGSEHYLVLLDTEGIDAYDQVRMHAPRGTHGPTIHAEEGHTADMLTGVCLPR